jgi:transcriptional regulator with XRE-family HTH domain
MYDSKQEPEVMDRFVEEAQIGSSFRHQLKTVMEQHGWSMRELSKRSGVTYDTIRRFLIGECDTTSFKLFQIARALGYSLTLAQDKETVDDEPPK